MNPDASQDNVPKPPNLSVDDYVDGLPKDIQPAVNHVREIARKRLPGFDEIVEYGIIGYRHVDGRGCNVAGRARYLALYISPKIHQANAKALRGVDAGKACIRFANLSKIDWDLVDKLFQDVYRTPS
jgi:uncharacterized protein DUF1801